MPSPLAVGACKVGATCSRRATGGGRYPAQTHLHCTRQAYATTCSPLDPVPPSTLHPPSREQVQKSGANLQIRVNTAQQRVQSEIQSVTFGVDNGTLAADLTLAGEGW